MSLTIELPPEMERQLRDEAAREGQDTAAFARALLEPNFRPNGSRDEHERRVARTARRFPSALERKWKKGRSVPAQGTAKRW